MWYLIQTAEIEQVREMISFFSRWPLPDVVAADDIYRWFPSEQDAKEVLGEHSQEVPWYCWNTYADLYSVEHTDAVNNLCRMKGPVLNILEVFSVSMTPGKVVLFDNYAPTEDDIEYQERFYEKVSQLKQCKAEVAQAKACLSSIYESNIGLVKLFVRPPSNFI